MSLDQTATRPAPGSPDDPFRLGWRYRTHQNADGTEEVEQIPLTPEDLLFPEEEDQTVQLESHVRDCAYLLGALSIQVATIPGALVLTDHRVQFDVPDLKALGPDVAVFFDTEQRDSQPGTLDVAALGARPILMIEVTSPDTTRNDLDLKRIYYHQAGMACYVIIDPKIRRDARQSVRLLGYSHGPDDFEPIPLDDQGRLWIEPLNLWLRIGDDQQVQCLDGATGRVIETMPELFFARLAAEEQARAAEEQARINAERWRDAEERVRVADEEKADMAS